MRSSQIKTVGFAVVGFALVVGFQNCSPTSFKASIMSTKVNASGATDPTSTVQTLPPVPAILVNGTDDGTGANPAVKPPTSVSTSQPKHASDCDEDTDDACDGKKSDDEKFADDARHMCDELAKDSTALGEGLNIVDHSGSIRFSAASFGKIQDNSGSIRLFGTGGAHGRVAFLGNNSGATLICHLDVDAIDSQSGKVVIVDGNVGSITNVSGLMLIGGKITGSISKTSGEIRQIK